MIQRPPDCRRAQAGGISAEGLAAVHLPLLPVCIIWLILETSVVGRDTVRSLWQTPVGELQGKPLGFWTGPSVAEMFTSFRNSCWCVTRHWLSRNACLFSPNDHPSRTSHYNLILLDPESCNIEWAQQQSILSWKWHVWDWASAKPEHMSQLQEQVAVGGGHRKDITTGWPGSWTWASRGSLSVLLSLECTFCPLFPQWVPFSRTQPWKGKCVETIGTEYLTELSEELYINHWDSDGWVWRLTRFVSARDKARRQVPCLLKPPLIKLEWPSSFFDLSLPSKYGGQFANQQPPRPHITFQVGATIVPQLVLWQCVQAGGCFGRWGGKEQRWFPSF